jgi:hypothetical protein
MNHDPMMALTRRGWRTLRAGLENSRRFGALAACAHILRASLR